MATSLLDKDNYSPRLTTLVVTDMLLYKFKDFKLQNAFVEMQVLGDGERNYTITLEEDVKIKRLQTKWK